MSRVSAGCLSTTSIIDVLAIILGAIYSGVACQSSHVSFDLGKWLLYGGIGNLAGSFVLGVLAANKQVDLFVKLAVAKILFIFAWFIVGVVIITTVTAACKDDNYTIYVMSIVYLVFLALVAIGTNIVIVKENKSSTVSV